MDLTLGGFGDRRLQKGGPFFWAGLSSAGLVRSEFGCLAATARARFVCFAFFAIRW